MFRIANESRTVFHLSTRRCKVSRIDTHPNPHAQVRPAGCFIVVAASNGRAKSCGSPPVPVTACLADGHQKKIRHDNAKASALRINS